MIGSAANSGSPNAASTRTSACRPRRGCCLWERRSGSSVLGSSLRSGAGERLTVGSEAVPSLRSESSDLGPRSRPRDRARGNSESRGDSVFSSNRGIGFSTWNAAFSIFGGLTGSSELSPHMLGFVFLEPTKLLETPADSVDAAAFGSASDGCSGAATPKKVATASQELLNRDGSGFAFGASIGGVSGSSFRTTGSTGAVAFGGFGGPSVFLAVGFRDGVLSRFAMLFQ